MEKKYKTVMYIVYMPKGITANQAIKEGKTLPYSAMQIRKLLQDGTAFKVATKKVLI